MDILLVMCVGIVIGAKIFPEKWKKENEKIQTATILVLIFCMGITLGRRDDFISEFFSLGGASFLFFLIPSIFSLVIALIMGIIFGVAGLDSMVVSYLASNTRLVLYLLMFTVGISIGLGKNIFQKIKKYHFKVMIIPMGIVVGSVLGGVVCSLLMGIPLQHGTAIASGLGWYSLSGIMVSEFGGATMGSIAFLSNLMREIFSFLCIPWIAKHMNYLSCIAPAGATSEDTTLPMLIRYTDEKTVVLAIFNGIICSALVPILIRFCYRFFI